MSGFHLVGREREQAVALRGRLRRHGHHLGYFRPDPENPRRLRATCLNCSKVALLDRDSLLPGGPAYAEACTPPVTEMDKLSLTERLRRLQDPTYIPGEAR